MKRPTAIVTGPGTGIGAAIAARLAPDYDLIPTHLSDDENLAAVADTAGRAGAATTNIPGDLTQADTIEALRTRVEDAGEVIAALVSNAGAW